MSSLPRAVKKFLSRTGIIVSKFIPFFSDNSNYLAMHISLWRTLLRAFWISSALSSKQENIPQTVDKISDRPDENVLENTPDLPQQEKVTNDEPSPQIIKNEPEPQNPQTQQRFTEEQIQILKDLDSPIIDAIIDQDFDKLKEFINQEGKPSEESANWAATVITSWDVIKATLIESLLTVIKLRN